jgi:hypothetical protein
MISWNKRLDLAKIGSSNSKRNTTASPLIKLKSTTNAKKQRNPFHLRRKRSKKLKKRRRPRRKTKARAQKRKPRKTARAKVKKAKAMRMKKLQLSKSDPPK